MKAGERLSNRVTQIKSHLKSKDDRKRRRAVRELFEMDNPSNLEAFIPLINDKDQWYRTKAIQAFRMWASKHDITILTNLIEHNNLEYNRVAANLLEYFGSDYLLDVKKLFDKDDITCKIKSSEHILKGDNEELFFKDLLRNKDAKLRTIAIKSKYANKEILFESLNDKSDNVVNTAIDKMYQLQIEISSENISTLISRGIKNDLITYYAVKNGGELLNRLILTMNKSDKKELVKQLKKHCFSLDDKRIQSLINNHHYIIIGRWLQGKRGKDVDAFRWTIIENETLDEIERCRLLERLFSRSNEIEVIKRAKKIANEIGSELIRLTAHNLSTADDRV